VSREAIRREIKHKGSDFDSPDTADGRWQPDEALVNEENKKSVRVVLEKMPERERWLLKALFLEERDKNEICRELGIDRDNLRVRVHRALKRTRGEWEKGHGTGE
jgi:RNA polymerase sigma-70 factor (ECF subfamily)